jgi:hypothetical protein
MTDEPPGDTHDSIQLHQHTEKQTARWGTFWWILSAILHLAAVFCIIYFTPLRYFFFKKKDASEQFASLQGGRVLKIVEQMLVLNRRRIIEDIEKQRDILGEMTEILHRAHIRYVQDLVARKVKEPPEPLEKLGPPGPSAGVSLQRKNILELYEIARNIELTTFGTYRQMRTVELSRIQRVPLLESFAATQVAVPGHPDLVAEAFSQRIVNVTDGRMDALKDELSKARSEVAAMVAAGQRMLDMARGLIGDDAGATFGWANWDGAGLNMGEDARPRRLDDPFDGYSPPDPDAFEHDWGVGVGPVVHRDEVFPRQAGADLGDRKPTAGRKLMANAPEQGEWMTIDTWYIIGPFPNPNREKLDHKYPPETAVESGVDLDATYIGMGGRPVSWVFRKSIDIPIIPHRPNNYAIWYAYTEIYSDRDQERWCIFGSDDYGKAWMNGKLIYASGKTPHPWIPDRAYKKLEFKKGFNPVLFKLENAWGRTGYSMCIYMGGL